jgi:hypothetical protein
VVRLQYEPSVLLTLADPRNLHDSDGAGIGKPHTYTCNLATAFYGIYCQDPRLHRVTHAIPMDVVRTCDFGLCDEASQLDTTAELQ